MRILWGDIHAYHADGPDGRGLRVMTYGIARVSSYGASYVMYDSRFDPTLVERPTFLSRAVKR